MGKIIEVSDLHKSYGAVHAVQGLDFYVEEGKLFAFLVTDGVVITQIRKHDREEIIGIYSTEAFRAGEREIGRWLTIRIDDLDRIERVMLMVRKSYDTVRTY